MVALSYGVSPTGHLLSSDFLGGSLCGFTGFHRVFWQHFSLGISDFLRTLLAA
jgi:hypothetical protein